MNNESRVTTSPSTPLPENLIAAFEKIAGSRNVLFRETDLALYAYDAAIDRAIPSAAVFPDTAQQISEIVKLCNQNKIPFVARGAGTNLCGGTIPLHHAVVIAPTRMKRIISIDAKRRRAVVEPGLPNLFLKKALESYGLYYAPDPASQKACTIGGNIGTNAGGPHCLKYGVTSHHVIGLEVVLPDGKIAEFNLGQTGPDLTGLFVGSEGTLGIVTKAVINLLPIPQCIETMLVSFPSLESAIQTVTDIISHGIIPATLEAMDRLTVQAVEAFIHAGYPLDAEAVLLIEVDGNDDLKSQVEEIKSVCQKNHCKEFRLAKNKKESEKLWEGRRGSYPAMARLAPNVLVEDGAVPRNKLPEALKKIRAIADENQLNVSMIFHAGDGNLHPQILFDERDPEQTHKVKNAGYRMLKACVDLGGTISGEHGIGIDKRNAMTWLFTPETLKLFRRIKMAFDPENLCNPDKLIPLPEEIKNGGDQTPPVEEKIDRVIEPSSERELSSALKALFPLKKRISIEGAKTRMKNPANCDAIFSTRQLNKILEHDVENFTVTAEAGILLGDLQKELNAKNQKHLLGNSGGTLGGLLATNPRQTPLIRDQVLGMKVALADGTIVQFGAKVMKNVAGYDAAKLILGSRGSLGIIVSVILKTYPENYSTDTNLVPLYDSENDRSGTSEIIHAIKRAFDPEKIFVE